MANKKNSKLEKRYVVYVIVFATVALFVLLWGAVSTIYNYNQRNMSDKVSNVYSLMQGSYDTTKLLFCYDRTIKPCSDENIVEWNAAHADDTFTLKTWQDIFKEASESVDLNQTYVLTGK